VGEIKLVVSSNILQERWVAQEMILQQETTENKERTMKKVIEEQSQHREDRLYKKNIRNSPTI